MTGLNAQTFAQRHGFDVQAYRRLERGQTYLKSAVLQQIIDALDAEGIAVSKQWIIDGTGEAPRKKIFLNQKINEVDTFKQRKKSIVTQIKSALSSLLLEKGDYVGGIEVEDFNLANRRLCVCSFKEKTFVAMIFIKENQVFCYKRSPEEIEIFDVFKKEDLPYLKLAPIVFYIKRNISSKIEYKLDDKDEDESSLSEISFLEAANR